jgi:hypothetical protein
MFGFVQSEVEDAKSESESTGPVGYDPCVCAYEPNTYAPSHLTGSWDTCKCTHELLIREHG